MPMSSTVLDEVNPVEAIASLLAQALGGFVEDPEYGNHYRNVFAPTCRLSINGRLLGAGLATITISSNPGTNDHRSISEKAPSINVTSTRETNVIVMDILRRLVPAAKEDHAKAQAHIDSLNEHDRKTKANVAALGLKEADSYVGTGTVTVSGDHIRFNRIYVRDVEIAKQIIALLKKDGES